MSPEKNDIVLLIGSPAAAKSTSFALGAYLLRRMQAAGKRGVTMMSEALLSSPAAMAEAAETIATSELLVVAFPLYVDHLPAPLIQVLEELQPHLEQRAAPRLAVIVNCGFPENIHNRPAVEIMQHFARRCGMAWAGALTFGQGGFVGGRDPERLGGMGRHLRQALDEAATALAAGREIPPAAVERMARRLMPNWFYTYMANRNWRHKAKENGARREIAARPYAR